MEAQTVVVLDWWGPCPVFLIKDTKAFAKLFFSDTGIEV